MDEAKKDPEEESKAPQEDMPEHHHEHTREPVYEPEYYEPAPEEMQATTNIIGWIVAIVLLALAVWLLWIALT